MVRSLQRPAYRIRTTTRVLMPPAFVFKDLYRLVKLALSLGPRERQAHPELTDHILGAADNMILKLLNEPQTPALCRAEVSTKTDVSSSASRAEASAKAEGIAPPSSAPCQCPGFSRSAPPSSAICPPSSAVCPPPPDSTLCNHHSAFRNGTPARARWSKRKYGEL